MTDFRRIIERWINAEGIEMSKQVASGGFLGSDVYDNRTVYNLVDLHKLINKGFQVEEDLGLLVFNALLNYKEKV